MGRGWVRGWGGALRGWGRDNVVRSSVCTGVEICVGGRNEGGGRKGGWGCGCCVLIWVVYEMVLASYRHKAGTYVNQKNKNKNKNKKRRRTEEKVQTDCLFHKY